MHNQFLHISLKNQNILIHVFFFFYVERLTELIQFITRLKTIKKNQLLIPFAILDLRQLD